MEPALLRGKNIMSEKKNNLTIDHSSQLIQNEKTEQQASEAKRIEEKQREAAKKADEASAALTSRLDELARKAREEQKRANEAEASLLKEREDAKKREEMLNSGIQLAQNALKNNKSSGLGGFLRGLLIGIIAGAAGFYFLFMPKLVTSLNAGPEVEPIEEADVTIENEGVFGYTAADFQEAVLGAASEHQELIVMEQPLSISTTITKAGLGNLPIFSKMKDLTYYGTGVYTVDLSHIDKAHILVDEDQKTVLVMIPHAVLQYVNTELNKTEFEDTNNGILAFGDIKLTAEETKLLEESVYNAMYERLDSDDMYEEADRFAKLKTWEIFQPLVTAVSPMYKVVMDFED